MHHDVMVWSLTSFYCVFLQEYAFETTDFPLILSLENHCCEQQQVGSRNDISMLWSMHALLEFKKYIWSHFFINL